MTVDKLAVFYQRMPDNRRTSQRYDRQLPVSFAVIDPDEVLGQEVSWRSGTIRNLSLGGCYIEAANNPDVGARIRIRFNVPTQSEAVETVAEVRWTEATGMGVQFGLRARDVWALGKFFAMP